MKKFLALIVFLVATFSAPSLLHAQNVSSVTGVVQDVSGAVVPGAKITLTNTRTGAKYSAVSSAAGTYRFVDVPPGPGYRLTFVRDGFAPYSIDQVYLNVGDVRTQDAKLLAGSNVQIEISAGAQGVTVNTTDATIGNDINLSKVNDLPIYDRTGGITALFNLEPGELNGNTAGARTDQNNVTLDGLDVNDQGFGDTFYIVANAPVDSVQEFRGTVAGFSSGSGQGGGGQFGLITKSGTNHFHGNINEYHRDTDLVANDYFNNFAGQPRAPLIRNQFGGNIGGPILHDKLFFFFNFNDSRIIQSNSVSRTVPLAQAVAGEVGYVNNSAGCDQTARENTTPNCITYLTPTQIAALDPAGVGASTAILALYKTRYPAPNDLTLGDGVNTGGLRFNAPNNDFLTGYVSRVDYAINPKMSLFGRGTVARENSVYTLNEFPNDPPTYPSIDRSYAYVVGHTWQISSTKTNQFIYGETKQNLSRKTLYAPEGLYDPLFFSGTTSLLSDANLAPASNGRIIPIQQITDNYNWTHNNHNITIGGTAKWIHSHTETGSDYNTYYVGLGGQTQGLNAATRPSNLFNNSTTNVNYDEAFTSILGRIGQLNETYNFNSAGAPLNQGSGSQRQYRYFQTEVYIQDSYKLTRELTVNYGLTYDLMSVPYELNGEESVPNTTFDQYMKARVSQSEQGLIGYDKVPLINYYLGGKANNGPALYGPSHNNFAPRFGVNYAPKWIPKTTFNASAGVIYDRTVVNALLNEQDQYSYLFQQPNSVPFGNSSDPTGSLKICFTPNACGSASPRYGLSGGSPAIAAFNKIPSTVAAPYAPFYSNYLNGQGTGLQNGGDFNISVDPALRNPYSIMTTFGAQHEFRGGFVAKVNYVGRYGRRLLAQADANQLVEFKDAVSGELLSTAMGNITKEVRAGKNSQNLPAEPFWENQLAAGTYYYTNAAGAQVAYPNLTSYFADSINSLVSKGDFADSVQAAASGFGLGPNVGMGAQFSENTFFTSKGFSTYQGLLTTLSKNLSHGIQFDFNYTYAHSIDNVSLIANSEAFTGYGFVCDVLHPRLCRGESDFDVKHIFTADFTYELPVGHGKQFLGNAPWYVDELIGGWQVSGITSGHSGQAYTTVASAFVASYSNDAPAIFNGDKNAIKHGVHETSSGSINLYANPAAAVAAFQGPIGFQIGSRNSLRGPHYINQDLSLGKTFPLLPKHDVNFKLHADAFNVLNHENFANITNVSAYDDPTQASTFGNLTATAPNSTGYGYRILQVSGRIEF